MKNRLTVELLSILSPGVIRPVVLYGKRQDDELHQHILRSNYQVAIHRHALSTKINDLLVIMVGRWQRMN